MTRDQVDAWWSEEMTFDLSDFLSKVEVHISEEATATYDLSRNQTESDLFSGEEVSTPLGRCYLLNLRAKFEVRIGTYCTVSRVF